MSYVVPCELAFAYISRLTSCHLTPHWCFMFELCNIICGFHNITLLFHDSMYFVQFFSHWRSFPILSPSSSCSMWWTTFLPFYPYLNIIPSLKHPQLFSSTLHPFSVILYLNYTLIIVHVLHCAISLHICVLHQNVNILREMIKAYFLKLANMRLIPSATIFYLYDFKQVSWLLYSPTFSVK